MQDILKVTDDLLRKLTEAQLLEERNIARIKSNDENSEKVKSLLELLEDRDDSQLIDFCKILKTVDQFDIVEELLLRGYPRKF